MDIAVNCNDGACVILGNQGGNGNHWLLVNTIGTKSNRDGIGAKLRIVSESGEERHAMVEPLPAICPGATSGCISDWEATDRSSCSKSGGQVASFSGWRE